MSQLGKYMLVRKLATGGMAEVFLAKSIGPMGFEKSLVLKRILPHLAEDPVFVEMFLSEGRLAAMLDHPNVVHIFELGQAEGAYYIAMEYIDGPNLRLLPRRANELGRRLPVALCARMISMACEALAYAHDFADPSTGQPLNLVHRDISSDNIMLSRSGGVKVVDFGIAKAANLTPHTRTGSLKGKFAYMPPEQFRRAELDRRADIFALGVVLYELIAGRRPFPVGSEAELIQAILFEAPAPITQVRPDVPEAMHRILQRALAKERDQRYPDCRAFQQELEQFILSVGEPVGSFQIANLVAEVMGDAQPARAMTPTPLAAAEPVRSEAGIPTVPLGGTGAPPEAETILDVSIAASHGHAHRNRLPVAVAAAVVAIAAASAVVLAGAQGSASIEVPARVPAASVRPPERPEPKVPVASIELAAPPTPAPVEEPQKTEPQKTEPQQEERRPHPRPQLATVRFETNPPARLRINDKPVGRAPMTLRNLQPGEVRVEAYDRERGFSKSQRVRLEPGDNGTLRIDIEPATLVVGVRPWAVLILDGKKVGQTPFDDPVQTWEGPHSITLVNQALDKTVTLQRVLKPGQNIFRYNLVSGHQRDGDSGTADARDP